MLIAEHYNNYFVNIGPKLSNQIPNCDANYHDYLHNPNPHSIFFYPVTEQEMHIIVSNLTDKKSSGHDMLNSTIIKVIFFSHFSATYLYYEPSFKFWHSS